MRIPVKPSSNGYSMGVYTEKSQWYIVGIFQQEGAFRGGYGAGANGYQAIVSMWDGVTAKFECVSLSHLEPIRPMMVEGVSE